MSPFSQRAETSMLPPGGVNLTAFAIIVEDLADPARVGERDRRARRVDVQGQALRRRGGLRRADGGARDLRDVGGNRAKAAEYDFEFPVVVQPGWRISKQYGIFATPSLS